MTSNAWCGYCGSTIAGLHLVIGGQRCHAMYNDSDVDRLQAEVAELRAHNTHVEAELTRLRALLARCEIGLSEVTRCEAFPACGDCDVVVANLLVDLRAALGEGGQG
jgi:hypothetical protein